MKRSLLFTIIASAAAVAMASSDVNLQVVAIHYAPLRPATGQSVDFALTVKNTQAAGGTVTNDFLLASAISMDQENTAKVFLPIGTLLITNDLAAEQMVTVTQRWTATTSSGHFSLQTFVDSTNSVVESSESDNYAYLPYRDLTVPDASPPPWGSSPVHTNGELVQLVAEVKNAGTVDINTNFHVLFRVNQSSLPEVLVANPVLAQGLIQVTQTWTYDGKGFTNYQVTVDSRNEVVEDGDGENNNAYSRNFTIGKADYVVSSLTYSPVEQLQGRPVAFTAVVTNQGSAGTTVGSSLKWYVNRGGGWVLQETDPVGGLGLGGSTVQTMVMTADYDQTQVKAVADADNVVAESDETNNERTNAVVIAHPDLVVGDIWWSPAQPRDGEAVTFYARVDNVGPGGTVQDFDVQFVVDAGQTNQVVLGNTRVYEDVPLGQRALACANSDFESGDLSGWSVGGGSYEAELVARYATGNRWALRLCGAMVRSGSFVVTNGTLSFSGCGSGGWGQLRVYQAATSIPLVMQNFNDGAPWRGYVVDVSAYLGQTVYVEVEESNYGYLYFDDLRLGSNGAAVVSLAEPGKGTWTARPGTHTITAAVDASHEVPETVETNQVLVRSFTVGKADYVVSSLTYSPVEQLQGRPVAFTAVVTNQGSAGTTVGSSLKWYINRGSGWVLQETDPVGGLGLGGSTVQTMVMTVDYDQTQVKAVADADNVVAESDETNNERTNAVVIAHPDLVVGDIWWSPAQPRDGEAVTFYARVDNVGPGGTVQDFDVQFVVDAGQTNQVVLGNTRVYEDVPLGQRALACANSDFESGDLSGWSVGGGSYEAELVARYATGNRWALRLCGAMVRSGSFVVTNGTLSFSGCGSGGWGQLRVYQAATSIPLVMQNFNDGAPWRGYVVDVSAYLGQTVYVEVEESNYGYLYFDDLRLGSNGAAVVSLAEPGKGTWTARPGTHTITATVDASHEVPETVETNQVLVRSFTVGKADYVVSSLTYSPVEQLQGRPVAFTAVVTNQGSAGTTVGSSLKWYVNRGGGWVLQETDPVGGLGLGGSTVQTMVMTVDYDQTQVKAVADADNVVAESDETNNERTNAVVIAHPDLVVGDIWWSPAQPRDGEAVTFYARVDNVGPGGTVQDFDVQFVVDAGQTNQVVLGNTRVYEDVPLGQRALACANSDFESGDLSGWSVGGGSYEAELVARYATGNRWALRLCGAMVRSGSFVVTNGTLSFSGYGSGGWGQLRVYQAATSIPLVMQNFNDGAPWRGYVVDVSAYLGQTVYVEVEESNYGYLYFDDLRLGSNGAAVVSLAEPGKGTWTARPGTHTITATVDARNEIPELSEDNTFIIGPGTSVQITATAGLGGTIYPSGLIWVPVGSSQTFVAVPSVGYDVVKWRVNTNVVQVGGRNFTLTNIVSNVSIDVSFAIVPVGEPLPLTIAQAGTNVILNWSTNAAGLLLQSRSSLAAADAWSIVTYAPVLIGDRFYVTNAMEGVSKYYRLSN